MTHTRVGRIIAFPKAGNIYTEQLYAQVERSGVAVVEGNWSGGWLLRHVRRGDLIHIHWPSFLYFDPKSRWRTAYRLARLAALMAFAKLRRATIVWTAHNLYPHEGGGELLAHRLGRWITVAFADRVFVHGASAGTIVTQELKVRETRLRIGHHPHWIDAYPNTVTRSGSRARLGMAQDEYLYLFIGRCRPYKGLESLIEAFPGAPQPARLLIAGQFSSPTYLESIKTLASRTPGVVLAHRSIPDDELQLYLNAADCVVLPYRDVLTSGAALLALSFGRPVVAPNLGCIRDQIDEQCGILYDPHEPSALVDALRKIRSQTFNSAAIIEHARQFTWSGLAGLLQETP
jgi:glycosyltransferase involved in cell wall biosynthesis